MMPLKKARKKENTRKIFSENKVMQSPTFFLHPKDKRPGPGRGWLSPLLHLG